MKRICNFDKRDFTLKTYSFPQALKSKDNTCPSEFPARTLSVSGYVRKWVETALFSTLSFRKSFRNPFRK